jgi:hypothetical protein
MSDDPNASATDLRTVTGREMDPEDVDGLALDVVPDEENDTVTFIAADADSHDTRSAWITAASSLVVDVTEMQ